MSVRLLSVTLISVIAWAYPYPGYSAEPESSSISFKGPVTAMFVSGNGYLAIQTPFGALISRDDGDTWGAIGLPTSPDAVGTLLTTEPATMRALYARGDEPLYRSVDGGATWEPILQQSHLPTPTVFGSLSPLLHVLAVRASSINAERLYAFAAGMQQPGSSDIPNSAHVMLRTDDGGRTWSRLNGSDYGAHGCRWAVDLLDIDPGGSDRVLLATSCRAGSSLGSQLTESRDGGATWRVLRFQDALQSARDFEVGYPSRVIWAKPGLPDGMFLVVNRPYRFGGSTLFRSDDDGETWYPVLAYRGGGMERRFGEPEAWNVQISGAVRNPVRTSEIYVARVASLPLNLAVSNVSPVVTSGVTVSRDGGRTWSDFGDQQLGRITDLAISPDGRRLYVASDQGLRVMRLEQKPE